MARLRALLGGGTAALAAAGAAHASTLDRSETHDLSSAASQYTTFLGMKAAGKWSRRKLDQECEEADRVQAELLRGFLEKNRNTEYGSNMAFSKMLEAPDPVKAFRDKHPLMQYQDILYYVEKIGQGEKSVMTTEPVSLLGVTSGTSGKRHLLPCVSSIGSHFFLRGITATFDTLFSTWPSAFGLQKTLKITYTPSESYTSGGIRIGPASSSPADKSFKRLLALYTTPKEAFTRLPEEESLYLYMLFALRDRKLGIIEANYASLPLLAVALLGREWERLAVDLERGSVSAEATPSLGGQAREALSAKLTPDPLRASEVRHACRHGPDGLLRRLWPDLHLILANSTGSFAPYGRALAAGAARGVPIYSPIYAATEGLLGVCLDPSSSGDGSSSGYTLVPSAMFFEFVPEECSGEAQPATLLASHLAVGKKYEVVVTTRAGLCRWRIGDVVRCVGFKGQSPIVRFCYRKGQVLNLRGEKVSEEVVAAALDDAALGVTGPPFAPAPSFAGSRPGYYFGSGPEGLGYYLDRNGPGRGMKAGPRLIDYTAAESLVVEENPMMGTAPTSFFGPTKPHYTLFLETDEGSGPPFSADDVDKAMQARSPVYASFRAKGAIGCLALAVVRPGTFRTLRERHLRQRGATPNQQKTARVARDAETIKYLNQQRLRPA